MNRERRDRYRKKMPKHYGGAKTFRDANRSKPAYRATEQFESPYGQKTDVRVR